ncbi:MAG: PD40 domain-containing protein [Polyangiaceae bacterium]|nr:PD40 domain-containing protein [Polyangiaceae bacterium]
MRFALAVVLGCLFAGCAARPFPPKVREALPTFQAPAPGAPTGGSASGASTLYFVRQDRLWRFDLAKRNASSMGVPVDCPGAGELGVGSDRPLLSPDGRFIAHLSSGRLVMTDVKTSQPRPVAYPGEPTPGRASDLEILLSGWSPDGRYFIFHVGYGDGDGFALEKELAVRPDGETLGFELLDSKDFSVRLLRGLKNFVGWAPDSRRVVVEGISLQGNRALFAVNPDGGHRTLLREAAPERRFDQFRITGEQAAWMDGLHVAVATLGSGEPIPMTPDGEFGTFQWPSLSPDGKHLAYVHRLRRVQGVAISELVVVDRVTANSHSLRECQWCVYRWSGAGRLVLEEAEGISCLDLDGNAVSVAGPNSTLVVVGQE